MAKLSNASKSAAATVASKIAGQNKGTPARTDSVNQHNTHESSVTIPGLRDITPDTIPAMMPVFNQLDYKVSDPLNPGNLPQASDSQYNAGMAVYKGATNALKLTGAAMDLTREKFTVIGKHAKAVGAGIMAATEGEKVKGNFLDYQSQLEVTHQKAVNLDLNQVKTVNDRNVSVHTKIDLAEKLKQAELKAQESQLKTQELQGKLTAFQQQLGQYK